MAASAARLPALDGFRAFSVLLVIWSHAYYAGGRMPPWYANTGTLGVRIFFVISGLLITFLLSEERRKHGRIRLGAFYARRLAKLLPTLWVFLAVIAAAKVWIGGKPEWASIARASVFLTGFFSFTEGWAPTNHTWSLSVEEAFYLLWAPFMTFAAARARIGAVLAGAAAGVAFRGILLLAKMQGARFAQPFSGLLLLASNADGIALGCVAGLVLANESLSNRAQALCWRWRWLAWAALPLTQYLRESFGGNNGPGTETAVALAQSVAAALLLLAYARAGAAGLATRLLAARPVIWLGRASYSLYIWQQPFFYPPGPRAFWQKPPLDVPLAIACGLIAFKVLEEPALRFARRRFPWVYE